jgi:MFS transporter, DHA2 family, methylenomycin A resistance protein
MKNSYAKIGASPRLTLVATSLGFVLIILDVTVVNVAVERIEVSLHAGVTGLQWVINAYALVFASLLLSTGTLSDRFGAKRVFATGLVLFTTASLICGVSTSLGMLITGRIAQGIGAALCVPSSLALLNSSFPNAASRAQAVGIWAGAGGLGLAAGPVIGGLLVDQLGWPTIFFLNLPLGLIGLWLTIVHAPSGSKMPDRGLDLVGQALAILGLGGLTFGFIESGELGWTSPAVLTGFTCFIVAAISFLLAEARSADPMLPLSLFAAPAVGAACLVGLLSNFAFYGLMFVLSLFFQVVKGLSPLATGLAFLPMTALVMVANLLAGWLTARFGPRLPMAIGQVLAGCGYLVLAGLADAATPYRIIFGPMLAAGIGVALTVPSMTTAVLANVQRQHGGVASGALNAARQIGGVIGVGVFGSLVAGGPGHLLGGMHMALIIAGLALMIGGLVSIAGVGRSRTEESRSSAIAAQACE